MTIRKKIMLSLILMAAIGISVGVVGLVTTNVLTGMSKDLHNLQIESTGASEVLNAHYIWRHGLTEAILTEKPFTGSLNPNTCALGIWCESEIAGGITDTTVLSLLNQLKAPHDFIHNEARIVLDFADVGNYDEAKDHLVNTILPNTQEVIMLLTSMEKRYDDLVDEKSLEIERTGSFIDRIIIGLIAVAMIACAILTVLVTKSVVKPLIPLAHFMNKAGTTGDISLSREDMENISKFTTVKDEIGEAISASASFLKHVTEISNELVTIAEGDISINTELLSEKDVLGMSIKKMMDKLNSLFTQIDSSSTQVSVGANEMARGSQALAQGSTQQAASIQQL